MVGARTEQQYAHFVAHEFVGDLADHRLVLQRKTHGQ
jgi:hypothetical protein